MGRPRRFARPPRPRVNSRAAAALLAALLLLGGTPAGAADGFLSEVEDLPLMPGLNERPDAGVAFDKPGGRIVEAYAVGAVERTAVLSFYAETLPQLGWQAAGTDEYRRDGEVLRLAVAAEDGMTSVRFSLAPRDQ